ncbi:MAG: PP2C family serine/threonine-protein phosphatase [Capnocytophaga sp.]|nr:PP2C family serine/threonine-protein phosphatase [Capnocytophaga sp.]
MENFLKKLLPEYKISIDKIADKTINKLKENIDIQELIRSITEQKQQIINQFKMYYEQEAFLEKHISITNANAKKPYQYTFDTSSFPNIEIIGIANLSNISGLEYDYQTFTIKGTPTFATSIELEIIFIIKNNPKEEFIKKIPFIVNADPKDLWKDIPSDPTTPYHKPDEDTFFGNFLDKKIVIASKRGRSHAHEGSTRDDHFAVKNLSSDWAIIAVADGAGSAKFARQGSKLACEKIVDFFDNTDILEELSDLTLKYFEQKEETIGNDIKKILYKEVKNVYNYLLNFSDNEKIELKDLNTTLIFALVKKTNDGYIILTFGVGDCPINVIFSENEVQLLNKLDIGEFGGGTRFITMNEIYNNPNMSQRFGIYKYSDFQKLTLMTDGIYDPKFVVESKLENPESWKQFLDDLSGNNEDSIKVDFSDDENVTQQLLQWINFWSKGNHDDRTLAIIY